MSTMFTHRRIRDWLLSAHESAAERGGKERKEKRREAEKRREGAHVRVKPVERLPYALKYRLERHEDLARLDARPVAARDKWDIRSRTRSWKAI